DIDEEVATVAQPSPPDAHAGEADNRASVVGDEVVLVGRQSFELATTLIKAVAGQDERVLEDAFLPREVPDILGVLCAGRTDGDVACRPGHSGASFWQCKPAFAGFPKAGIRLLDGPSRL